MAGYRCPLAVVDAIRQFERQFPAFHDNFFVYNDVLPIGQSHIHNSVYVNLVKQRSSSPLPADPNNPRASRMQYLFRIKAFTSDATGATSDGTFERLFTLYIHNLQSSRAINAEATRRAMWYMLLEPETVRMIAVVIHVDPRTGEVGYERP